jgi:hypothetical protein
MSNTDLTGETAANVAGKTGETGHLIEEKFVPRGAIAFFICLVALTLIFWYSIYYLMIVRS